jgi:hypothetical protein
MNEVGLLVVVVKPGSSTGDEAWGHHSVAVLHQDEEAIYGRRPLRVSYIQFLLPIPGEFD